MIIYRTLLTPLLFLLCVGCSSIESTSDFKQNKLSEGGAQPIAHIHSDIWGIYFLGFESFPVITGSSSEPGEWHWFRHTVSPSAAAEMVFDESRRQEADAVINLKTDWDSSWQTATLIFWLKEAQASGSAIKLSQNEERKTD